MLAGFTDAGPGDYSSWIAVTDDEGYEVWSLLEGGGTSDGSDYVEPTRDGGFIQGGETWSYSPHNDWDGFIRKLDIDGNQEWARVIGEPGWLDYIMCVREIPGGGYIATGEIGGHVWFGKFGASGQTIWQTYAQDVNFDFAHFVEPTRDGEFVCSAQYEDNFVVAKLSNTGNLLWEQAYADNGMHDGISYCVRELTNGDLVSVGFANMDFTMAGGWYVVYTDQNGLLIWESYLDPEARQEAREVWIAADGNIVVGGWWQTPDLLRNYKVIKYTPDGEILWEYMLPDGIANSIAQTVDGGYVFGGEYHSNDSPESTEFRLIKLEPEVEIELQPWNPQIPAEGGWLRYAAQVSNILFNATPLDAWIVVTGPNGQRTPLNSFPVTLQPGATFTRPRINVWVPPSAPNGEYTLEAHLGVAPPEIPPGGPGGSRNMGLGSFTFTKGE
ncbi:hypothetical protein KQI52_05415 [bacterium]|nr:hypothetical protein [bacterium]